MPKVKKFNSITVEMPNSDPKKKVLKFTPADEDEPAMSSAYIANEAIESLGGCPDGVKITIEAL